MDMKIGETTLGELLPLVRVILVLIAFLIFCVYMAIQNSKGKKNMKETMHTKLFVNHFYGLPVVEGTHTVIEDIKEEFLFTASGNEFRLNKNKITDISIKRDVDIQKQYVSSVGGAIGGAALFGSVGAMIGGRAKEKKTKTVNRYIIFTYIKDDGNINYMTFECFDYRKIVKMIEDFNKLGKGQSNVVQL